MTSISTRTTPSKNKIKLPPLFLLDDIEQSLASQSCVEQLAVSKLLEREEQIRMEYEEKLTKAETSYGFHLRIELDTLKTSLETKYKV